MRYSIDEVSEADIRVLPGECAFEQDHASAIAANWKRAQAANPALFNGRVHLCAEAEIDGESIRANLYQTQFATLLYWRQQPFGTGLRNTFGDVILRGCDGGILLGRMASDTANAGKICLPGGSFDDSDVNNGRIDPTICIRRECREETGFGPDRYTLDPQMLVYRDDRRVAFARLARLTVSAAEARAEALAFIATEDRPELDDIIVVSSIDDADRLIPDTYERHLIAHLFRERTS
ncbi:MAG: NUDIX domain-containing protein [Pseudomonadota bacterium]